MKSIQWQKLSQNQYTHLLLSLILLIFSSAFVEEKAGSILLVLILWGAIILVIRTFKLTKIGRFFFNFISTLAFILLITDPINLTLNVDDYWSIAGYLIYSIFIGMSIFLIIKKILLDKNVSADTLLGGVCIYLLIGILWFLFYKIIHIIDSDAFTESIEKEVDTQLVYFSFTTLTTLGYGDISPVHDFARLLTNLEAIIGQMFPAIFIARLVSLYTAQELEDRD